MTGREGAVSEVETRGLTGSAAVTPQLGPQGCGWLDEGRGRWARRGEEPRTTQRKEAGEGGGQDKAGEGEVPE